MARISNISGFPEWLPEQKLAEDAIIARIKKLYESAGYVPIETPAAELISTLCAKGVIDKEIYALKRAQAGDEEQEELALHFDLTVPFARYVALHFNDLLFPFKRYQVQKVWRGDRPQKGRFREFYQFDIDVIARDELPLACDAEVISLLDRAFASLAEGIASEGSALGSHLVKFNNRKLLLGFYSSLGLSDVQRKSAITVVDKIDKIEAEKVHAELVQTIGVSSEQATKIVDLTKVKVAGKNALQKISELSVNHELWNQGREELLAVLKLFPEDTLGRVVVDLSLARGLDYYTGSIFEVTFPQYPEFGSVGSGGRYEDLASEFINKKLPGVGASFGLTRMIDLLIKYNLLDTKERCRAKILVTVYSEDQRRRCNEIADELRRAGIGAEVYYRAPKLGKQIEYAESKGMSYVLFLNGEEIEVKNLATKEQVKVVDLGAWARVCTKVL